MRPPQEHIKLALQIEKEVPEDLVAFYLECLNGVPISKRTSDRELYDGCILTHHVYMKLKDKL